MKGKVWTSGRTEWALFLVMFFSAAYFQHPVDYDNTLSRYFLMSSVVDFGRLDLEMYRADTIDLAVHGGRYYSNKPIGLPLLAAPVYWAMRRFTVLKTAGPLSLVSAYLTRVWAVTLPYALLGPILYHLLLAMGVGATDAFLAVLAYALGTLAWVHAALFSGHQTAASLVFLSYVVAWRLGRKGEGSAWRWLGAGALAGLGAICEYQAAFAALAVGAYALRRAPAAKARWGFAGGLAACLALLAIYDLACFGSPWSLSQANQGPEFADYLKHGFLGVDWPSPKAAFLLLASPARGLFFTMPVLLMALPGFMKLYGKGRLWRAELALFATIFAGELLINAGYVGWHAGWTFGPRYFVSTLPFWIVPLAFGLDRRWFVPLFLLSAAQMGLAQAVMPHAPQAIWNPVVECFLPLFRAGYRSGTLGSLLGLAGVRALVPWLLVAGGLIAWGLPRRTPAPGPATGPWRLFFGGACLAIVAALCLVRSPKPVRHYNVKLLSDLYEERPSPELKAEIEDYKRR